MIRNDRGDRRVEWVIRRVSQLRRLALSLKKARSRRAKNTPPRPRQMMTEGRP